MIDVEALLVTWAEAAIAGVSASTKTPPDLQTRLPWLRVASLGGPYDGFRVERPTVDIEAFAATADEALDLANQVQLRLHRDLAGATTATAVVSRVQTLLGPHELPYDNPAIAKYGGTYRLALRPV